MIVKFVDGKPVHVLTKPETQSLSKAATLIDQIGLVFADVGEKARNASKAIADLKDSLAAPDRAQDVPKPLFPEGSAE